MSIYTKLTAIQRECKVPKNMYNSFGKFNYRSAESILEAVKPILQKYECVLLLSDDILQRGDRFYIEATATLIDTEDNSTVTTTALAREADSKKGMDAMQLSGCASSYARKYCLNGLFLLDDARDADCDEFHHQTSESSLKSLKNTVKTECRKHNIDPDKWLAKSGKTWSDITGEELGMMLQTLKELPEVA